jgi:toxin YoeB
MVKRVIWTRRAQNDRKAILTYWIERNQSKAYSKKLDQLFRHAIQIIRDYPGIGKPTNEKAIKIKIVKDYLIIYRREGSVIYILTIWDSRQNPEKIVY